MQNNTAPDHEISLVELASNLWKQRATILTCTVLALIISTILAFSLPKTYYSEAVIAQASPANFSDIIKSAQALNQIYSQFNNFNLPLESSPFETTPETLFEQYSKIVTSRKTLNFAFNQAQLLESKNHTSVSHKNKDIRGFLNQKLKINPKTINDIPRITISYLSNDPNIATQVINNSMILAAKTELLTQLEQEHKFYIKLAKDQLEKEIENRQQEFISSNKRTLIDIENAINVASLAGQELPALSNIEAPWNQISFLMGSKALNAMRTNRENIITKHYFFNSSTQVLQSPQKPFIPGIVPLIKAYQLLSSLKVNYSLAQPILVEQPAYIATIPEKPNKTLIIAGITLLGIMLGFFIALARIAIRERQAQKEEKDHQLTSVAHYQLNKKLEDQSI